jgi:very-short-patch-repair endonuclease
MGLEVLRFTDRKVKEDLSNVLRCIEGWMEERQRGVNARRTTP